MIMFGIHDSLTKREVSVATFLTFGSAQNQILEWRERSRNGKRPDISPMVADRMYVVELEGVDE